MIKAYMGHPIRGPLKDKATHADMKASNEKAMVLAKGVRTYMGVNYPDADLELYVPAEHEDFVNRAFRNDMLTVQQILHIDCQIIEEEFKDLLLVFAPFGPPVEGCSIELVHATKHGIPSIVFKDLEDFKDKMEAYLEAKGIYE